MLTKRKRAEKTLKGALEVMRQLRVRSDFSSHLGFNSPLPVFVLLKSLEFWDFEIG